MIGSKLANRYELREELGRGGMGVVYRAHDPVLKRDVAIKILPQIFLKDDSHDRFQREAQLVAQLDHPGIVPIHDFGSHDGSLFFVMPVVEGTSLRLLIRDGELSLGDILDVGAQVAEALDYSHRQQVVHRDIKPENVMVTREGDGRVRVRLMDFGLALGGGNRLTKTGLVLGTMCYFSPEQAGSAEAIDGRSDLYGLGTILYECLAGEPPFTGSLHSMVYRTVHEPAPSLRGRGVEVDETLEEIILGCLAKDPAKRPQRGQDLAEALRAYARTLADPDQLKTHLAHRHRAGAPAVAPFIGREDELAALLRSLEAAAAGSCQLAVVAGEAGSGKTRLLQELETVAAARRVRVLRGRFSGRGGNLPYQGFSDLIQDYFRSRDSSSAAAQPDLSDLVDDLLGLFPSLAEVDSVRALSTGVVAHGRAVPPSPEPSSAADRTAVFELLAKTLGRLAAGKPILLLLENLHDSEPSAEALQYIVHRLGPTPALFVVTFRPGEVPRHHALARVLDAFAGDSSFTRLDLGPLDRAEHRKLVEALAGVATPGVATPGMATPGGASVGDDLVARIFDATEGNPFFTVELVRSLLDTGGLAPDRETGYWRLSGETALSTDSLPVTIQAAVEKRIARLPEDLRTVLAVGSVLGRTFDFADLEALVGDEVADVDEAVDRLIQEAMLEEDRRSRGDRLSFASGLVRDVLYAGLARRRRRSLHRRQAERLEKRWEGRVERVLPQLVYHFCEGDVAPRTVHYALALARQSLEAARPEDAVRAARTALELVEDEEVPDRHRREGEARELLALALRAAGKSDDAHLEAQHAVQILEKADLRDLAARAAFIVADTAWSQRRIEETVRWVDKGLDIARAARAEAPADAALAETLARLLTLGATVANLRGGYEQARAWLAEAEALRPRTPDEGDERPTPGGVLVTSLPSPPRTLDPALASTAEDAEVLGCLYEPLLYSDGEGNLVAGLATDWDVETSGRSFRLRLAEGVRFSDGTPLDATLVKRSLERYARVVGERLPPAFHAVVGTGNYLAGEEPDIEGLVAVDDHTLAIRLVEVLPFFLALLTDVNTGIVHEAADGELLGTGPFRIAEHDPRRLLLAKNAGYRLAERPFVDALELRTDLDAAGVAAGLEAGEIDLGRDLVPEDLERLLRQPRFRNRRVEALEKNVYYVLFNALSGPTARNPAVRRALAGAVRVEDLVWRTLGRYAQPAIGFLPPGLLGHDPGRRPEQLTKDEAAAILAAEGLATPIRLHVAIHPLLLDRYTGFTRALFDEWEAIGVELDVDTPSMEAYAARWRDNEGIDLRIGRWIPDYDDPDNAASGLFHSRSGLFRAYFSSPEADALAERARRERATAMRQALYRRFEDLLLREHAVLPLFHDVDYRIAGPRVRGLRLPGHPPYVNYAELGLAREGPRAVAAVRETAIVRVALPTPVGRLEPAGANFVEEAEVVSCFLETLTRLDEGAQVVPNLASEVRLEEGGRRFRLRLRENVHFHDGRRLTVRDVRHSFERLLRTGDPAATWALQPIRGARAFRDGRASEIAGLNLRSASELELELEEPLSFYPAMLTHPTTAIVPEGTEELHGNWREACIGTGPFRVVRFDPGERLELEANPLYWRSGLPRCDRLIFELGTGAEKVVEELRGGHLSLAKKLRPADVERLRGDGTLASDFRELPGLSTYFLAFRSRSGPLADRARRRALVRALDLDRLVRSTLGRVAVPASGLIPPGLLGHESVRRAAAPPGDEPPPAGPVTLKTFLHPAYLDQYPAFWSRLCELLAAAGFELEVVHRTTAEMVPAIAAGEVDLFASRWIADYPDPDSFVGLAHPTEGLYGSILGHEEIAALVETGRREADPALRHATYRRLEQVLARDALLLPLFHEQITCFARPEIRGLRLRFGVPEVAWEELSVAS